MNDEFNFEADVLGEQPAKPKGSGKMLKAEVVQQKAIDPEYDRENWPTIRLEAEDGKPNYEFLSAHGTLKTGEPFGHELQVMRGVDVQVPPSIVYALRDAVAAHYSQRQDPITGRMQMIKSERSSIPWHLVKAGKHLQ